MVLLDKHSSTPYYLQVSDALKSMIVSGYFSHGQKLPTLTEMNSILNISLKVIAQAYDDLSKKGYVYSRRGKGYFVSYHQKIQIDINDLYQLESKLIYDLGMKKGIVMIETIEANQFLKENLNLKENENCFHVKQYYGTDHKNVVIQDVFLPVSKFPRISNVYQQYLTLPLLLTNGYGYKIKGFSSKYTAVHSIMEHQLIMRVPINEPLWRIDSLCLNADNEPVCLVQNAFSGEYVTMAVMIDAD